MKPNLVDHDHFGTGKARYFVQTVCTTHCTAQCRSRLGSARSHVDADVLELRSVRRHEDIELLELGLARHHEDTELLELGLEVAARRRAAAGDKAMARSCARVPSRAGHLRPPQEKGLTPPGEPK